MQTTKTMKSRILCMVIALLLGVCAFAFFGGRQAAPSPTSAKAEVIADPTPGQTTVDGYALQNAEVSFFSSMVFGVDFIMYSYWSGSTIQVCFRFGSTINPAVSTSLLAAFKGSYIGGYLTGVNSDEEEITAWCYKYATAAPAYDSTTHTFTYTILPGGGWQTSADFSSYPGITSDSFLIVGFAFDGPAQTWFYGRPKALLWVELSPNQADYEEVQTPAAPGPGYSFDGWFYNAAFSLPYLGEPVTSNVVLYAKWVYSDVTVTVHVLGITYQVVVPATTSLSDIWAYFDEDIFVYRYGLTFLGWDTELYEVGAETDGVLSSTYPFNSSTDIYAWYELRFVSVTLYSNGSNVGSFIVPYGTTLQVAMSMYATQIYGMATYEFDIPAGMSLETALEADITIMGEKIPTANGALADWWAAHDLVVYLIGGGILFLLIVAGVVVGIKKRRG